MIVFNDFFYTQPWSYEIEKLIKVRGNQKRILWFMDMFDKFAIKILKVHVVKEVAYIELSVVPLDEEHDVDVTWFIEGEIEVDRSLYKNAGFPYGRDGRTLPFEIIQISKQDLKLYYDGVGHKFGVMDMEEES
jgi:hypothetical protein